MNTMESFNVHVVYRESGEIGNSVHLVYAKNTDGVLAAMQNFYGDDLIAVVFI